MATVLRIIVTLIIVALAVVAGRWVWDRYLHAPWTRDGRVQAHITTIAPDVSGWVTQLHVADNEQVAKDQPLFAIDAARYEAALAEQKAVRQTKALAWQLAKLEYQRRQQMAKEDAISQEALAASRLKVELAQADYNLANAQLAALELSVARTQVKAPQAGTIVNLDLREGNYVEQGRPVLSLVRHNSFYVTGYFEETKLPLIHIGQRATITLMSSDTRLTGKVTSIGRAIADTNVGRNEQLLPRIQQTFNWVRLAQRVPVEITLDPVPESVRLVAGTTASITLNER